MSIMDKLKKNSKLSNTEVLSESKFFNEKAFYFPSERELNQIYFKLDPKTKGCIAFDDFCSEMQPRTLFPNSVKK